MFLYVSKKYDDGSYDVTDIDGNVERLTYEQMRDKLINGQPIYGVGLKSDNVLIYKSLQDCIKVWTFKLRLSGSDVHLSSDMQCIYRVSAFANTEFVVPDFITAIGRSAFSTEPFESVDLGNGVEVIGSSAFRRCFYLKSVKIPDSVIEIEDFAFDCCSVLDTINIPKEVRIIAYAAFRDCVLLKEIELPETLEVLGESAFYNCASLTRVVIPDNLEILSNSCFAQCDELEKVIIGKGLRSIESNCFMECTSLKRVVINAENLIYIGSKVFERCFSLEEIIINGVVDEISPTAFEDTYSTFTIKSKHEGVLKDYCKKYRINFEVI